MKQFYTVLFLDHETGKLLKRFEYPANKIHNQYFWEKLKQDELAKLTKRLVIEPSEVLVVDTSTVKS
ncbi:MAG TPA: hypothetical protein VGD26_12305 [Chitinophagaceae bacterium]